MTLSSSGALGLATHSSSARASIGSFHQIAERTAEADDSVK
jgi:hypothetical protein